MAILWTFIGQNMDFGQKLAKTWETHIRYQHRNSIAGTPISDRISLQKALQEWMECASNVRVIREAINAWAFARFAFWNTGAGFKRRRFYYK